MIKHPKYYWNISWSQMDPNGKIFIGFTINYFHLQGFYEFVELANEFWMKQLFNKNKQKSLKLKQTWPSRENWWISNTKPWIF